MSASEGSLPQNQFPMKHEEISEMEYECPPFKKPRISATFPNSGQNEARTRYFKTQLCRKFRLGMCTLGSRCSFAHSIEELRRQEIGGGHRTSYEPKLCRMFSQGKQCSYGSTCRFLHARPDSMNSRENTMVEVIPKYDQIEFNKGVSNESFDADVNQKRVMQKTKLCNSWETKGCCPFGMNCRYAHGQTELGKLDGYSTSECRVMQTSASTATPTDASMVGGPLLEKEPCVLNCRFKKNELQKISRIYADWI